jgi:subtilase family serine protease
MPRWNRSSAWALTVGVLAGVLLLVCSPASDAHETVKLRGNHPTAIAGRPTGRIDPQRMLTMTMSLKLRDPQALSRLLSEQQDPSSPNYHRWLTPQQFAARFGPEPAQFKALKDWLKKQGFEVVSSSGQRRTITFRGSAGRAQRVFKTKILTYGKDSYANVDDPSIPARFADVIGAITGLDNVMRAMPLSR